MSGRLIYQSDETLHSFIFRVCMVNGVEQFAGVTGKNFRWRKTIHLNENIAKYFKYYNDHDFLFLIRNSWQACKSAKMFSDPTEYLSDLKNIYANAPRKGGKDNIPHIKHCMNCIKESIKINGYGYFKSSWHYQYSEKCMMHNKGLSVSPITSFDKPYERISTILRGKHPVGCYSVLSVINTIEENTPSIYIPTKAHHTLPYDNGDFIYIADCWKREIKNFILSFPGELPEMALMNDLSPKVKIQHYRRSYLSTDSILARMISYFFDESFVPFESFWKENAFKTAIPCGVINIGDIVEHIYIFRNMDACRMCNSGTCPVKMRSLILRAKNVIQTQNQQYSH